MNELVTRFPAVTFGSYPEWSHQYFKALLTAETVEEDLSEQVSLEISRVFRPLIMTYDKEPCQGAWDKIQKLIKEAEDEQFKVINCIL